MGAITPGKSGSAGRREGTVTLVNADPDDDVTSLRVKLAGHSGDRVALVLPDDCETFDAPVTVHLLARVAIEESVHLAIVSGRPMVRSMARAEGLVTFSSAKRVPRRIAQGAPTLVSLILSQVALVAYLVRQSLSWISAVAVVATLGVLALALIPRAVVVVRPHVDPMTSHQQIRASIDAKEVDPVKALVPAHQLYLAVSTSGQLPIKGGERPLDGHAVGYETFENRTSDPIKIPAGTVVSTLSGIAFATTSASTMAARPGATVVVPIRAVLGGGASNVRRGEIIQIQGKLRWVIVAVNEDQIAGGGAIGAPIVTSWDVRKLTQRLATAAQRDAGQQLTRTVSSGETAVDESVEVTPIEEHFDHPVGSSADVLKVDAVFRASAIIVDENRLRQLAVRLWRPVTRPGFDLETSSIGADSPTVVDVSSTRATFDVPVHGVAYQAINVSRVIGFARLQPPDRARQLLSQQLDLAAPPAIAITPNWIGRAYRVDVVVDTRVPQSTRP